MSAREPRAPAADLLAAGRKARRASITERATPASGGSVAFMLRMPRDLRVALRVRKAETGTDMQDIICDLLERELADELASVRARSVGGAR